MLYETVLALDVVAVLLGVLTTITRLSISSLGLLVACVTTFSLLLHSKKRKVDELHCLIFCNFDILYVNNGEGKFVRKND